MQKKMLVGVLVGFVAGCIDVIPMVMQDLSWNADLSALSMWIVVGFLLSVTTLKMSNTLKGLVLSYLMIYPYIFMIGFDNPLDLIPVFVMTTLLGTLSGFVYGRICREPKAKMDDAGAGTEASQA